MWGPTASCPGCSKHLTPHCAADGCPWGRCESCGAIWNKWGAKLLIPYGGRR